MGSIPITRSTDPAAHVAQSVEHVLGKDEVTGSIPVVGSTSGPLEGLRNMGEGRCSRGFADKNLREHLSSCSLSESPARIAGAVQT